MILFTNLVQFQVLYQDYVVGRAYINPLNLLLGTNVVPSEFHYMPGESNSPIAQGLLTQYLETKGNVRPSLVQDLC